MTVGTVPIVIFVYIIFWIMPRLIPVRLSIVRIDNPLSLKTMIALLRSKRGILCKMVPSVVPRTSIRTESVFGGWGLYSGMDFPSLVFGFRLIFVSRINARVFCRFPIWERMIEVSVMESVYRPLCGWYDSIRWNWLVWLSLPRATSWYSILTISEKQQRFAKKKSDDADRQFRILNALMKRY